MFVDTEAQQWDAAQVPHVHYKPYSPQGQHGAALANAEVRAIEVGADALLPRNIDEQQPDDIGAVGVENDPPSPQALQRPPSLPGPVAPFSPVPFRLDDNDGLFADGNGQNWLESADPTQILTPSYGLELVGPVTVDMEMPLAPDALHYDMNFLVRTFYSPDVFVWSMLTIMLLIFSSMMTWHLRLVVDPVRLPTLFIARPSMPTNYLLFRA
jgi:hypothetical protein